MEQYKVTINGKQLSIKANETILNASINQGGGIFIGCKGGGCGMCKIKVVSGETMDGISSKSVLPDHEYHEGYRLACQSKPKTNLEIVPCR